jgi:hypothetical protein
LQKFQTPQSRRLALLDSYDRFQQRGTVTDHRLRFERLCMQLEHVGVLQDESITASKYLRSLRPDLRNRVELKYTELPDTLEAVHAAALDAEYAKPTEALSLPLHLLLLNFKQSIHFEQTHGHALHFHANFAFITRLTLITLRKVLKSKNCISKANGKAHGHSSRT